MNALGALPTQEPEIPLGHADRCMTQVLMKSMKAGGHRSRTGLRTRTSRRASKANQRDRLTPLGGCGPVLTPLLLSVLVPVAGGDDGAVQAQPADRRAFLGIPGSSAAVRPKSMVRVRYPA